VRLGVAATPDVALPTLEWLLNSEHELALIITQPDRPAGRGRIVSPSIIAQWADSHGIAVIKPGSAKELIGKIEDLDLVLTIGYGVILPELVLNLPKFGFLNLHFSLLPAYRGAAPVQRALENGEGVTGVTVFKLDKGMDTGPIYTQQLISIEPQWRSTELLAHLAQLGVKAVSMALELIQLNSEPTPQSGASSMAPKISKIQAKISFSNDAQFIVRQIRAFTYQPGAWTVWKGEPFRITRAVQCQDVVGESGEIFFEANTVRIACGGTTGIEILEVVATGKKEMSAISWARGARLRVGDRFG